MTLFRHVSPSMKCFALTFCLLTGGAVAAPVNDVLAEMDRAAGQFRSVTAALTKVTYTAIIKDTAEEKGKLALRRPKLNDIRFRVDFTTPDQTSADYHDKLFEYYHPKINTVQIFNLAKHRDQINQYLLLLLGFGTPGSELRKSYDVKLLGEQTVASRRTFHLELTPTRPDMQKDVQKVDMWLDAAGYYPVRQRVNQASGNYTEFQYSNIKLNPDLSDEDVKLTLPKGVKKEYPQK